MGATASRGNDQAVPDDLPPHGADPHNRNRLSSTPPLLGPHDRTASSLSSLSTTTTEFKWDFGGHSVYVTGAWDDWNMKVALSRTTPFDFTAVLSLPLGTFQYKFIVDGNWRYVFIIIFAFAIVIFCMCVC